MSTPMRFTYGSGHRAGFNPAQSQLLVDQTELWNQLAKVHNEHVAELVRRIGLTDPAFGSEHAALLKTMRGDQGQSSGDKLQRAWRKRTKLHVSMIQAESTAYYRKLAGVLTASPLYWHNKDAVNQAFGRAARRFFFLLAPVKLRRNPVSRASGSFTYRLTQPTGASQLCAADTPLAVRVELQSPGRAMLHMPVSSSSWGKYEMACWPIVWHRPLPANARVKAVTVIGRWDAGRFDLHASFLLEMPAVAACDPSLRHPVGIDVGWRMSPLGLRVATAAIGDSFETLWLPPDLVLDWDYAHDLAEGLEAAGEDLKALSAAPGGAGHAGVLLAARIERMKAEYKNKMRRIRRRRLNIYQQFARQIALVASRVQAEQLALWPMLSDGSSQGPQQRQQQSMAAVSELLMCVRHACAKEGVPFKGIPAFDTTRRHHTCGHLNPISPLAMLTCAGCGQEYDPDENAALNVRDAVPAVATRAARFPEVALPLGADPA